MFRPTTYLVEGVEAVLAGFIDYLREQRCVSRLTVEAYTADVRRFLERRGRGGVAAVEHGQLSHIAASARAPYEPTKT